jgi:hypothetical protein
MSSRVTQVENGLRDLDTQEFEVQLARKREPPNMNGVHKTDGVQP